MKLSTHLHVVLDSIPDTPAIKSAAATTLVSASGSIWASMAGWDWTGIIACGTAIAGLVINFCFSLRRDRRDRRRHADEDVP